jgi:hypothetical protein
LAAALPLRAWAADGRIELNQAKITAGSGFPFYLTTTDGASWVLTSDIVVPSAATTGLVLAAGVSLDLNGFTVRGPVTCSRSSSYDATTTTCTASGAGVGLSLGPRTAVRNGRVTGMGSFCISVTSGYDAGPLLENLHVDNCAGGGVNLYGGTLRNSNVNTNGADGVTDCFCGGAGIAVLIEHNVIAFNKEDGVGGQGEVRDNRISYNGGAGIKASGAVHAVGNYIQHNEGRGIDVSGGSYLDNEIASNDTTAPGQVKGGTDAGGNVIH